MKRPLSCILLLLLVLPAGAQERWDLRRCVDHALANNISVKQQDVQARLARLTYDQAKLSQYPNLALNVNTGLNSGRSIDRTTNQFTTETVFFNTFGLQSNVNVFNFFSTRNGIAAYRLDALAAGANVEKVRNDIALNVALVYLQVLQARQQVEVLRVRQRQTGEQLATTRKQVNAGALPELNAAQLEAQVAQDSANVVNAKTSEIQALYNLKALLALDAAQPFDVVTPPVELIPVEPLADLQPQNVYALALQNLPQQRVNSLRVQSAQYQVKAARGAMLPTFSLSGSLQSNISSNKNTPLVDQAVLKGYQPVGLVQGTNQVVLAPDFSYPFVSNPYFTQFRDNLSKGLVLGINVPIFNGGQLRTQWRRAQLNVQTFTLQQELDSLTIKQDIYKAYADAINALEKFNAATKAVEAADKANTFAQKRYNIGLLSTLELINAQTNLTTAQLQRASAQFEYVFRMKLLEFYKGQGLKL
ncbi:MAG: TolC family protein [Chitinophagaceae bacterium]|nr:MAG: TolC family protein [Chitinophagaceae bacterium]